MSSFGQDISKRISIEQNLAGTWQWTNLKDSFTVKIAYSDTLMPSKVSNDTFRLKIYGWHKYVGNGVLVENTFADSSTLSPSISGTIKNNTEVLLWLNDITRARYFRVQIEFLNFECTIMRWITDRPQERTMYPPPKPKIWEGQTIPSPIVLHKISD